MLGGIAKLWRSRSLALFAMHKLLAGAETPDRSRFRSFLYRAKARAADLKFWGIYERRTTELAYLVGPRNGLHY